MTADPEIPFDANVADVVEQRQPIIHDNATALPDELSLLDVDPADAIDQHLTVPIDDDDWPTG